MIYWQSDCGSVTLYHGDCLEVMQGLEEAVDVVITDPPFRVTLTSLTKRTPAYEKLKGHDWQAGFAWIALAAQAMKDGAAFYVHTCDDDISVLRQALADAGLRVCSRLTWIKTNPMPSFQKRGYRNSTEIAFYGNKGERVAYFRPRTQQELRGYWVLPIVAGAERTAHPTQKPLALWQEWIENSCPPGGTILDPFAGSGTTGVACVNTGRRAILIEREEAYCRIARERCEKALAERASRLLEVAA